MDSNEPSEPASKLENPTGAQGGPSTHSGNTQMSVAEAAIQAQIDGLSTEIMLQKAILAELERRRGVARRQLNAIRDPVARLPLEITSKIFVHCLPPYSPFDASSDLAPLLLLNVCKIWADIALGTTELWTVFDVHTAKQDLVSLLEVWTKRAGSRPLSISLPYGPPRQAFAVIGQRADHLDSFKMYHNDEDGALVAAAGPFLTLRTLTLVSEYEDCSPSVILDMLRSCPNVVEFTLDGVNWDGFDDTGDMGMLVLTHLQALRFRSCSSDDILPHLTLPGLQTLTIPCRFIGIHRLTQFLKRSSPSLQRISVGEWSDRSLDQIAECFPLLSTVVDFEFWNAQAETHETIFAALASSPHLLPNVSKLTLWMQYPPSDHEQWFRQLQKALFARRTQLRVVNIIWSLRFVVMTPPPDVVAQLRQLVLDGMELYVGSTDDNYNYV